MAAPRRPDAVLFACNLNRVRSPMAEGLMKLLYGTRIYIDSCGMEPSGELDPFAVAVMQEIGADLTHHHAKSFEALSPSSFDLVVALTPEAYARALASTHAAAVDIEYWPTPDPTDATGDREARLEAYRATRDALRAHILRRFGEPSTKAG